MQEVAAMARRAVRNDSAMHEMTRMASASAITAQSARDVMRRRGRDISFGSSAED
jgi:hypothetical protein